MRLDCLRNIVSTAEAVLCYEKGTVITNYCPNCGERIRSYPTSGIGKCDSCGMVFDVIELKENERRTVKD